jgi:hypothetical protein
MREIFQAKPEIPLRFPAPAGRIVSSMVGKAALNLPALKGSVIELA